MMTRMTTYSWALLLVLLPFSPKQCSAATEGHLRTRNAKDEQAMMTEPTSPEWEKDVENDEQQRQPQQIDHSYYFERIERCFGDCDTTDQCEEGLVCFHREIKADDDDDREGVPGCSESINPQISMTSSVCISPSDMSEEAAVLLERTAPIMHRNLLGECMGYCSDDSDCSDDLVCFQRDVGEPVPGCPDKYLGTSRDYCVVKPSPPASGVLGLCEGDCDKDWDCAGDLVCHQRNAWDPIPSGCTGALKMSTDYCVIPEDSTTNNMVDNNALVPDGTNNLDNMLQFDTDVDIFKASSSTSGPFRLKIYWQKGYNWQGENFERKWCLARDYNTGGTCWAGLRRVRCSSSRVYVTKCSSNSNQQFTFVHVNNDEVLIKVYGQDRCLSRSGVQIELRSCNKGSQYQRFFAPRGAFNQYRFEISQKTASRYCLNQDHHPKNGEYVQMFPCSWARAWDSLTSYWEKY